MMRRLEVWRDEFFAWVRTLASAAVYATLIVTFGFQVARVEGQSMAPTLADQDRLIVNKLRYRLTAPQRGDIVMLYYPLNPDKSFVKRVIAEEGDTVRVVDGRVYVNDVPMRDDFVPAEYRSHDDWGPQVIPEGYYFVMGDHRNNSSDSRHWGFVPKKYIIGKVQVRWWPVPHAECSERRADVREVSAVLYRVLFLNLIVAAAKIALGLATGAVSVLSDGFHSLTDTASNVVGIIGVRIAGAPPDDDHPYGHRKFETMASLGILVFLLLVLREVLSAAWERLADRRRADHQRADLRRDGRHVRWSISAWCSTSAAPAGGCRAKCCWPTRTTRLSDLMTSATVIVALIGVKLGYLWLDPVAALVVAVFIGYACWEIFKSTTGILADRFVIPEEAIREVVKSVPEVIGCHHIRTRGSADFVFLDLHIWMDADMPLDEAHSLSHVVKDRLMARFPQIKDAIIHIEPPPTQVHKSAAVAESDRSYER